MKNIRDTFADLILVMLIGIVPTALPGISAAATPAPIDDRTEAAGVPEWGLGPFVRSPENPILKPRPESVFQCPIQKKPVAWESKNVVGTGALVKDDKVYLLYRAEPNNCNNSRIGLGISSDGLHFVRLPEPVLYPAEDAFKQYEWPGGIEDGRIVQREDGLYILLYPAYNGQVARQCVATCRDPRAWTKHGPAFAKACGGKYLNAWSKSGSIVSRYYDDGRVVAARINGKYWMYVGDRTFFAAHSDDCIQWTPVENAEGRLRNMLPPRPGKFDSVLTEPGPPPIVTPKGILVIYTGKNDSKGGDPRLPHKAYSGGQALFDLADPTKLLSRCDDFFITPRTTYELDNAIGCPVTFLESMVRFHGKWLLYYGSGDKVVSVAICESQGFENKGSKAEKAVKEPAAAVSDNITSQRKAMEVSVIERSYGPQIQIRDWSGKQCALKKVENDLLIQAGEGKGLATWTFHPLGGGGDVRQSLTFRVEKLCPDSVISIQFHQPNGFMLAFKKDQLVFEAGERKESLNFQTDGLRKPHTVTLTTLARQYELCLDGNRIVSGTISPNGVMNEGRLMIGVEKADLRLSAFSEEFVSAPAPVGKWEKKEVLYAETFTAESFAQNWVCTGPKPTISGGMFTFNPMSVTILKRKFDSPMAMEFTCVPMKGTGEYGKSAATDAIFIWMMQPMDKNGDLFKYLGSLKDASLPNYNPLPFYWIDFGGTANQTTRFRKNPNRWLVRQFTDAPRLLAGSVPHRILIVQNGDVSEFYVNDKCFFRIRDPAPYLSGQVGFRAFVAPLKVSKLKVWSLK